VQQDHWRPFALVIDSFLRSSARSGRTGRAAVPGSAWCSTATDAVSSKDHRNNRVRWHFRNIRVVTGSEILRRRAKPEVHSSGIRPCVGPYNGGFGQAQILAPPRFDGAQAAVLGSDRRRPACAPASSAARSVSPSRHGQELGMCRTAGAPAWRGARAPEDRLSGARLAMRARSGYERPIWGSRGLSRWLAPGPG
jgi:hypothetical protein